MSLPFLPSGIAAFSGSSCLLKSKLWPPPFILIKYLSTNISSLQSCLFRGMFIVRAVTVDYVFFVATFLTETHVRMAFPSVSVEFESRCLLEIFLKTEARDSKEEEIEIRSREEVEQCMCTPPPSHPPPHPFFFFLHWVRAKFSHAHHE